MLSSVSAAALAFAALLAPQAHAGEIATPSAGSVVQFANPAGMPRWAYSFAVSTPAALKTVTVQHITAGSTTGDLKAQVAGALANLDRVLASHGADRSAILVMDSQMVGGSLRDSQTISDGLKSYFDGHLNGTSRFSAHDYPVRTVIGEPALAGKAQVAFDVKFVDVKGSENVSLAAGREVDFGGVSAQQPDFTIKGYGDAAAEGRATIENLKKVLAQSGMTLANVTELNVVVADPVFAAKQAGQMIVASNGALPAQQADATTSAVEQEVKKAVTAALQAEGFKAGEGPQVHYVVAAAACAAQFKVVASGTARS
jgi:enamine deaminase RidA (YjgF/YER057c/UK114 family)